jgi:predicted transcriptional regulator
MEIDATLKELSRREREIMNIIYSKGRASASEVHEKLEEQPSYSTVRALLNILEKKGYLTHEIEKQKYIYCPVISKKKAVKSAIGNLLSTFFNNSVEQAVAALIEYDNKNLKESEIKKLSELINEARREDDKDE